VADVSQPETLPELAAVAEDAARAGGAIVRERGPSRSTVGVALKAAGDYVSDVDRASEAAVSEVLRARSPRIAVLAEEAGGPRDVERYWVVDPLDGTTNYLHGFPAVGVSVALVEAGEPIVGVVHAPLLAGEMYVGWKGGGSWLGRERLSVSSRGVAEAVVGTGFPFRRKEGLPRYLELFHAAFERFEDLRRPGAAALDLSWVAAGVFDGFFELSLGTWDVAAGALLIREAGGVVTDWEGGEAFLGSGDILAGPPEIHEELLSLARRAGTPRVRS
jgi:myo-inositol-1(or 4)-monophosphatase